MLQHPRAGNRALLGNVTHQEGGDAAFLAQPHQQTGTLAHLTDAPGGGGHFRAVHGLDGVHHRHVRGHLLHALLHVVHGVLRQHVEIGHVDLQAAGAKLHLLGGFLAADVQHALSLRAEIGADLQKQRRLADAGVAADKHQSALNNAAAQHPIQFPDAGRGAGRRVLGNIPQEHSLCAAAGALLSGLRRRRGLAHRWGHNALLHSIPRAAAGAPPHPSRRFVPASRTGEHRFFPRHAMHLPISF